MGEQRLAVGRVLAGGSLKPAWKRCDDVIVLRGVVRELAHGQFAGEPALIERMLEEVAAARRRLHLRQNGLCRHGALSSSLTASGTVAGSQYHAAQFNAAPGIHAWRSWLL